MHLQPLNPLSVAAGELLALSDAYMAALYPAESNHMESPEALARPNVCFVGAWLEDTLVGCGAVKVMDDDGTYGEIKRVFVRDAHRGRGISRALMQHLENHLIQQDVPLARLETGISQPEALGLYRALGYRERPPFGHYRPDPYSIFMEKVITMR